MALDARTALERSVLYPHGNERHYLTWRAIAASADALRRFRTIVKVSSVPIVILLVVAALGPEKWAPRSHLGWQFDHIIGYFVITLLFCFAWPRPFLVGGAFMVIATLLEGLQALTPDRTAYLPAAIYGACGALAAAVVADFFIQAWRINTRRTP